MGGSGRPPKPPRSSRPGEAGALLERAPQASGRSSTASICSRALTPTDIILAAAMIELRHVGKVYQVGSARIPSLTDVSFRVDRGEFVVLHGPSGAGKTTLLRLLYRAAVPTEGEVEVLGHTLHDLRRSEVAALRRSIGVVFQDAKLLQARTVYDNIAFVLRVLGTPRRAVKAGVLEALRTVGLGARAQSYPSQLSQGEAQRAALARAIVRKPPLLLADEPTGNLDDDMAGEVLGVIRDIWACGTTVLLATHQSRLAAQLRRRTLRLEGGRLVKDEG